MWCSIDSGVVLLNIKVEAYLLFVEGENTRDVSE
jgi:hypothetical protein